MKSCAVCGSLADERALSCSSCGEASWKVTAASVAAPAKKPAAKKASKKSMPAPIVDEPVESIEPVVSDAEFAEEIAAASDDELLSLLGEAGLSDAWRKLLVAEIDKRGAL